MEIGEQKGAFISPIPCSVRSLSFASSAVCCTKKRCISIERSPRNRIVPCMQQTKPASKKEKGKKRATPTFATDIKGNIVWNLRSATMEDVDQIYSLVEEVLSRDLVESFVSESPCCVVCEASVKGTKQGEGYFPVVMGIALVDITLHVKDKENPLKSDLTKHGDLVTIAVDSEFPDTEAPKKLLLGSLKKMKDYGVIEVTHQNDNVKRVELVKQCLFKEHGTSEFDIPLFICNLAFENPDPMKKLM